MIDRLLHCFSLIFALCVFLVMMGIVVSLCVGGFECMKSFGWRFLSSSQWDPSLQKFGALVPILGTLTTAAIALLIAVPMSFGISFFITEILPAPLKTPLTLVIELLAVIPSIIYGMWGLFIFAPRFGVNLATWLSDHLGHNSMIGEFFKGGGSGINVLTASIILAIMVIPFITITFKDAFDLVPRRLKESAYALGCTTFEVVWCIVIPYVKSQIIGGTMLGLGRALGETMAVAFVIGNAYNVAGSILQPGTTIASSLANEFTEAESELYTSALVTIGLILFVITFIILAISRVLLQRLNKNEGIQ